LRAYSVRRETAGLKILLAAALSAAAGCAARASDPPPFVDASSEGGPGSGRTPDGGAPGLFDAATASDGPDASLDAGTDASPGVPDASDEVGTPAAEAAAVGSSDGGSDESATGCPGLFCEDFERGAIDPTIWSVQANGGQTVTVQTKVVAHGKYAAEFHANPNITSYDFIITKDAPAALRGHHFGRAYFNVTPKPPAEHTEFLFAGTAGFPKLKYLEVAGIGTEWQLTYVDLIGGGESYASGGSAPDAQWICLEWEFNDTPDQATVFVNGVQSYARDSIVFMGQATGLVGGFTDFGFGYYAWHPASYAFDIYYDDIVLDTTRVGCLAAP
jgi:hypothetical protein